MLENVWESLPYPFLLIGTPQALDPKEFPSVVERLLEDVAGLAGVIAMAADHEECDQSDIRYATRILAEYLHATVALWRQWQEQEEPSEAGEA